MNSVTGQQENTSNGLCKQQISQRKYAHTFNCGVGLVLSVNEADEENVLGALNQRYFAKRIGRIEDKEENEEPIILSNLK